MTVLAGLVRPLQAPAGRPAIASDPEHAAMLAELLKAVAHPLRLRIVASLVEGSTNVTALAAALDAPQAIVSQQLRILRQAGLVAAERRGGFATYRLAERNLKGLVRCLERCER
jgi:ArsR family transcriptional regulator